MKWLKRVSLLLLLLVIGSFTTFLWLNHSAEDTMQYQDKGEDIGGARLFESDASKANFIFYPGGLVDYDSYFDFAHMLSQEGINVIVVDMPFNLAILNRYAFDDYYEADNLPWFVGGHSLGAAAAAYPAKESDNVEGYIALAGYPPESIDLSDQSLDVLTIHASLDGVIDSSAFEASMSRYPENSVHHTIEGGNHAGFGKYGSQRGDNPAKLSTHTQHEQTVQLIVEFIDASIDGT